MRKKKQETNKTKQNKIIEIQENKQNRKKLISHRVQKNY